MSDHHDATDESDDALTFADGVPYGIIIAGVLVAVSAILSLSQDGKPLIMFSETTVILAAALAIAAAVVVFFGPGRPIGGSVIFVLAVLAILFAVGEIIAYEQAVAELQRDLSNF